MLRPVRIEVADDDSRSVAAYASIPIAFEVAEELVTDSLVVGERPLPLRAQRVPAPYLKDYDAHPGNSPLDWPSRYETADWHFLVARLDGQRVGGAIVVPNGPEMGLVPGRDDVAVLWDLRVAPAFRRRGVGRALLGAAEDRARANGAHALAVETQHVNVTACRFYAAHGFVIHALTEGAYADAPDEVQLIWYKPLDRLQPPRNRP